MHTHQPLVSRQCPKLARALRLFRGEFPRYVVFRTAFPGVRVANLEGQPISWGPTPNESRSDAPYATT
jgi:hypothetical protein